VPELQGRRIEKSIWKWIERYTLPSCNQIYTVSQGIADLFHKEYNKQVDVISNFPYKHIKSSSMIKVNIIIYQGDLNEGRGIEMSIKAMDKLSDWK
jgi:hypothetical protein